MSKTYLELLNEASRVNIGSLSDASKQELISYMDDIAVKAARENFYVFVKLVAPERIRGTFRDGLHIRLICDSLQRLYENIVANTDTGRKTQVFLPPESMKSELCTIIFPSWCIGRDPSWRVLAVAHGGNHARKHLGKPAKDLCRSEIYQRIFPKVVIDKESKSNEHWNTTMKGGYIAVGVGASLPGKRANLTICDDVVSEQTAYSKLERTNISNWVGVGLESRLLEGKSGQLVVNTRWHLDDISGYLEKRDKESVHPWEIIRVPAILDQLTVDLYAAFSNDNFDPEKYFVGGSYWPEHKPVDRLLEKKSQLPPHHWAACYLQNPIAEEGSIYKKGYFSEWQHTRPPDCTSIFAVFDTAFTEEKRKDAARSGYTIWGVFDNPETAHKSRRENMVGSIMLLGAEAGYWSWPELIEKCQFIKDLYRKDLDFFVIENKASGISLLQDLRARGYPVFPYNPDKSKEARAWRAAGVMPGRVFINPDKQFTKDFISEVLQFPYGPLKDYPDMLAMAVLFMVDQMVLVPEAYSVYSDLYEDDNVVSLKPRTYWQAVKGPGS